MRIYHIFNESLKCVKRKRKRNAEMRERNFFSVLSKVLSLELLFQGNYCTDVPFAISLGLTK